MASAAPSSPATTPDVDRQLESLKLASSDASVPPAEVFSAMMELEKSKQSTSDWERQLNEGDETVRHTWRLVFASTSKDLEKARKTGTGGGNYFPITAVQSWTPASRTFQNGVFFGRILSLVFVGPYATKGKKISFDVEKVRLRLGPFAFSIQLKRPGLQDYTTFSPDPKSPFFLCVYADDSVIVARGRGGGIALWVKPLPEWELANGIEWA
ncbi:hypothetical protein ACKKBG_A26470 [Auxenochlorella protothecoides x Auxenochlorella symbiontica]